MSKMTKLKKPIKRGEKEITSINLQEPNSGSLRGLELMAIMRMDVTQVRKLTARISDITEPEFDMLCPADIASVSADVVGFFME